MLDIGREDVLLELLGQLEETVEQTGIVNLQRKLLSLKLKYYGKYKVLEKCLANGQPLSFEILDIDYFKQYNDNYGHQAGDECVKAVANLLRGMENEKFSVPAMEETNLLLSITVRVKRKCLSAPKDSDRK